MKKRILAMALACLMLIGVLPVNGIHAHAADTQAQASYKCPGKGAEHIKGEDYCNFDYDPDKALVVPSVCDEIGYTLYQCLGCGEHIAADTNYGPDGIGSHEYGELIDAVEPNCVTKTNGTYAHYFCEVCKNYFDEDKVKLGKDESVIVWEYSHSFVPNSGDEVDCTKDGLVCEDCGYEAPACKEHDWGKAEMFMWPTITEDGRAIEWCENEGCTQFRLVLIEKQCMHPVSDLKNPDNDLTYVPAKDPTCTEDGWLAHYICEICTKANDGETVYLGINPAGQIVPVTEELIMLDKLGHDHTGNDVINHLPDPEKPLCHPDNEGAYATQYCNRCKQHINKGELKEEHKMVQYDKKNPTCTDFGADYYLCSVCGYLETALLNPLGHNGYNSTEAINKHEVSATCSTPGKRTWTCNRETEVYDAYGNHIGDVNCDHKCEETVPVVLHKTVTLEIERTCQTSGWLLSYCAYPDCAEYALKTEVQGFKITALVDQYNDANPGANITVPAVGVHVIDFAVYNKSDCVALLGHTPFTHDENCLKYHNWDSTLLNQPTCTESGSVGHICADCKAYWHEEIEEDGMGHNMEYDETWTGPNGEKDTTTPSTCADTGLKVTYCKGHIMYDQYGKPTTTVHPCHEGYKVEEVTPAITMDKIDHIYDWSEVVNVGTAKNPIYMPLILTIHTQLPYTTYTENGATYYKMTEAYKEQVKGDCETLSIYYIDCLESDDGCGRGLFITDGISGQSKHELCTVVGCTEHGEDANPYVAAKDATCFEGGWEAHGHCKICKANIEEKKLPRLHDIPGNVTHVEAQKAICGDPVGGWKEHWSCDCDGTTKYYDNAKAREEDLLTEQEHEALHYVVKHNYVEHCFNWMDCEQFGFVHMICQNEGCIHGDVAPYGDDKEGYTGVLLEVVRARGHWLIDATCEVDQHCGHNGCEYEIEGLEPALGHENAAGESLSRDCLEDIAFGSAKDRVCVNGERCDCWAYDEDLKEWRAVVEVVHDWYDELIHVDGSCQEYECDIKVCKKCALNEKINQGEKDPDNHKWVYENGAPSYTNATKATCLLCGKVEYVSLRGIQFHVTADNANAAGYGFVDSSLVKLNIAIESIQKVGLHTFRFDVTYDAENMYYVGFEAIFEDLFANVADNIKLMVNDNGEGVVTCLFVADNDEDGELQDIVIEKLELLNLYFRIKLTEENNDPSKMYMDATNTFNFAVTNVEALDAEKNAMVEGSETFGFAVDNAEISVEALGDTDNTGGRELSDVQRAYELFITGGYHIGADINQNGYIDIEDIQMAYQYAIYAIEYSDLWECGVED